MTFKCKLQSSSLPLKVRFLVIFPILMCCHPFTINDLQKSTNNLSCNLQNPKYTPFESQYRSFTWSRISHGAYHSQKQQRTERCSFFVSYMRPDKDDENYNKSLDVSVQIPSKIEAALKKLFDNPSRTIRFSILISICGAILGPFLDSYHSAFGVLQYDTPITAQLWSQSQIPALITTWWVPPLFGLAGFIIGWLYILLDSIFNEETKRKNNTNTQVMLPIVFVGISLFTFLYWLSGVLYAYSFDRNAILVVMSIVASFGYSTLDNTKSGIIASFATAFGGPGIEIGLISYFAATSNPYGYHYTDTGETGFFPLWIIPVYFLGGPAVGNLARYIWKTLSSTSIEPNVVGSSTGIQSKVSPPPPGCVECNDTRLVLCPNCDGVGTYVATGGRTISCTSCSGRGYVICRSCFAYYGDDPYDIDAIREMMSRLPD